MRHSRIAVWLFVFSLLALSAAALDFSARMEPEERTIAMNETAVYNLILSHTSKSTEQFEIYSPDVQWDLTTDSPERLVTVHAGEERIVQVTLRPLYVNPGSYVVPIHVRLYGKNQLQKTYVLVNVLTPGLKAGEYLPAVRVTPKIKDSIDPRQDVVVTVLLENLNRKDLQVDLKVRSTLVNADARTSLKGLEKKEVKLTAKIDPLTPPQKDTLKITALILQPDRTYQFDGPLADYQVIGYGEIELGLAATKELLKQSSQYTFTNSGNVAKKHTYRIERTIGRMLFSSFTPDGQVVKDGDSFYEWQFELEPKESLVITEVSNYRPLAYILFLVLIVIIAYYYFRSPLIVAKSAMIIATKEAGISELKVIVQLKNRGKHSVKQVTVIDHVPRIAEVIRDFDLGTIRPETVLTNDKKGTLLKWKIDELETGEERIISYKMRSSLSILGGLRLPVAVAKCVGVAGKEHKTTSNLMQIGFGEKL